MRAKLAEREGQREPAAAGKGADAKMLSPRVGPQEPEAMDRDTDTCACTQFGVNIHGMGIPLMLG